MINQVEDAEYFKKHLEILQLRKEALVAFSQTCNLKAYQALVKSHTRKSPCPDFLSIISIEEFKDKQTEFSAATCAEELKTFENMCKAELVKMNQLIGANKAIVKDAQTLLKSRAKQLQTIQENKTKAAAAKSAAAAVMGPPLPKKAKINTTGDILNFEYGEDQQMNAYSFDATTCSNPSLLDAMGQSRFHLPPSWLWKIIS
eukprot:3469067-Pyramimonas_sp.AAC.1